jgi:chromosome segregation protein
MKLKKLELFGFKSFYDKTVFEFSDGITAIVGPNGCGKSNIVDAIRWVLGEHAPSYLRSKALEDVIFAGSDAAGPLGMAEVCLTFFNEDGAAPPGYESYAEIQVTRRTFRNGESEFLINKVPCRLKDIAELFLDTGAGARGYAIIEQGKIMTIVNARPEEKRMIVEEAAGVAKFRVRKKEAERKMENTRANLARVKDILDEVKRQLGSLERQVRKAERYKALKDELRGLDLRIAARKFRDLSRERAGVASDLAATEDSLLAVRTELSRLEAEIESRRLRLAETETALGSLREVHGKLKEEVVRREAEYDGNRKQVEDLRGMIAELADGLAAVESEMNELACRVTESDEAAAERRKSVAEASARCVELNRTAASAREEFLRHKDLADQARSDLIVRVNLHSSALSSADSYQKRIEDKERERTRQEERIAEARSGVEKAERQFAGACEGEASAREGLSAAERVWEETGALLAEAASRFDAAVEAHRRAEGALQESSSKRATLSRLYERKDWASSGVRAVLRHYHDRGNGGSAGGETGIYGVIGDLVETDAPYERAVEAVLGERMQSIVVRDHNEGLCALQYLKDSREGRGSFVPVSLRTRNDAPAYAGEDGVIAPLTEIVRAPSECRDLVRGLLGGTLLVRDMECALRLWNRNGVWNTYVTLDGDVVTAEGALTGGAQADAGSGILAVKREMRDLEKEIDGLTEALARRKAEEEEGRRSKVLLEERKEEKFRLREDCAAVLHLASLQRARFEEALTQARDRLERMEQEREFRQAELERINEEHRASQEEAHLSAQAKGEEEERVRQFLSALEEKRVAWEDAQGRSHAAEIDSTERIGRSRAEEQALAARIGALAGKRVQAEEMRRRRAGHEERSAALAEAIEGGRVAVEEGAAALSRLQEKVDSLLEEKAAIAAAVDSLEGTLKDARRRGAEAASLLSDLRVAVQRVESELGILDSLTYNRYETHPADLPAHSVEPNPEAETETAELDAWETRAGEIRDRVASIGDVNLASLEEHRELSERHSFLAEQKEDLETSLDDLTKAIQRINRTTRERFSETFEKINEKLAEVFPKLFLGGRAFLTLLEEENLLETGVELVLQPPGKKLLPLNSFSGGEKSLAAAAMILSIFLVKPSPFCLLDEADTALDDANIDRFNALVRDMSDLHQFLLITHNKRTMELADSLYGITMEKPGISKVVSVKFNA